MYYIQLSTIKHTFLTAEEAWNSEVLVPRRAYVKDMEEFKERLDSGQVIKMHAAVIWKEGTDLEGEDTEWLIFGKSIRGGSRPSQ